MPGTLYITGDTTSDGLLNADGTALLLGMLLDQQVPMEWAFAGPAKLYERLGHIDATKIAAMNVDEFVAVCTAKPAIHRFPAAMGRRIHELCTVLADEYGGAAENLWRDVPDGATLYSPTTCVARFRRREVEDLHRRARQDAGCAPAGWQDAAGKFGDEVPRSVADIDGPESLAKVREWKQAQKAAKRDKQDRLVG